MDQLSIMEKKAADFISFSLMANLILTCTELKASCTLTEMEKVIESELQKNTDKMSDDKFQALKAGKHTVDYIKRHNILIKGNMVPGHTYPPYVYAQ